MERVMPKGTERERRELVRLSERLAALTWSVTAPAPTKAECDRVDELERVVGARWEYGFGWAETVEAENDRLALEWLEKSRTY